MIDDLVRTGIGGGVRPVVCDLFSCGYSPTLAVRLHMGYSRGAWYAFGMCLQLQYSVWGDACEHMVARALMCGWSSSGVEDLGGSSSLNGAADTKLSG